jgi:hypothetical protein
MGTTRALAHKSYEINGGKSNMPTVSIPKGYDSLLK